MLSLGSPPQGGETNETSFRHLLAQWPKCPENCTLSAEAWNRAGAKGEEWSTWLEGVAPLGAGVISTWFTARVSPIFVAGAYPDL